jgi:beta-lactamase superfamily II metal-dependent hydrolase
MSGIIRIIPRLAALLWLVYSQPAVSQVTPTIPQAERTLAPAPKASPLASPAAHAPLKAHPPIAGQGDILIAHFVDIGHGDSCLIQTPGGSNILIDGGFSDVGQFLVSYLKRAGVKKLAMVIASHPHSDHIGGLPEILKEFDVETVLDSGKVHPTTSYRSFMEAVKASQETTYTLARAGQVYKVGGVTLNILSPRDPLPRDVNDCSIVCRLVYGDVSIMFTGDAGEDMERKIVQHGGVLKSTALKVPHHGSKTSSSSPFLRAVNPAIAVISCREKERRGTGAPHAVHKLKTRRSDIYRTDQDGTILFESDGKTYIIKTLGDQAVPD